MRRAISITAVALMVVGCAAAQDAVTLEKMRLEEAQVLTQNYSSDPAARDKMIAALDKLAAQSAKVTAAGQKMMVSPVTGAPYSAEEVTEFNQTLADGTRIHTEERVTISRDGQGRVRRETPDEITIADPVAGASYTLSPKTLTGRKMATMTPRRVTVTATGDSPGVYSFVVGGTVSSSDSDAAGAVKVLPRSNSADSSVPAAGAKKIVLSTVQVQKNAEDLAAQAQLKAQAAAQDAMHEFKIRTTVTEAEACAGCTLSMTDKNGTVTLAKGEALGPQNIEGVIAEGTRNTESIPVGAIGNDRPIQVLTERWYSDQLKTMVMTKKSDPRTGEETFRLTNIRLGEPDPSLFAPPPNYQISGR